MSKYDELMDKYKHLDGINKFGAMLVDGELVKHHFHGKAMYVSVSDVINLYWELGLDICKE